MSNENLRKESIHGFVWRAIQNFSSQFVSFLVQILLARILLPSDFGLISLTTIFVQVSSVFVQTGLTSALVQKKEIDETDKSTMFFVSCVIGLILYAIIFVCSPFVSLFFNEPLLTDILRVQSLSLIFASFASVSIALITRELRFKKTFYIGVIGYVIQGFIGIFLALKGNGVWSLVLGTLAYNCVYAIGMFLAGKWFPKRLFSLKKAKELFSFSSNVLFTNLLNTIYNSSRTIIVGRVYDSSTLGYYNKGNQFPSTIMSGVDGAMTTVLYSSLSKIQDDDERFVRFLRKSLKISLTVVTPIMCGLAAISRPLILVLLTEKWVECVPFLMIYCAVCLSWPLSAKTHALNAKGKSRITFLLNLIIIAVNILIMLISIKFGIIVFALCTLLGTLFGVVLITIFVSKFINYSIKEQFFDVAPIYGIGLILFGVVYSLSLLLNINIYLKLFILVVVGILVYFLLSLFFKLEGFMFIFDTIKGKLKNKKNYGDNV